MGLDLLFAVAAGAAAGGAIALAGRAARGPGPAGRRLAGAFAGAAALVVAAILAYGQARDRDDDYRLTLAGGGVESTRPPLPTASAFAAARLGLAPSPGRIPALVELLGACAAAAGTASLGGRS